MMKKFLADVREMVAHDAKYPSKKAVSIRRHAGYYVVKWWWLREGGYGAPSSIPDDRTVFKCPIKSKAGKRLAEFWTAKMNAHFPEFEENSDPVFWGMISWEEWQEFENA